MIELKEMLGAVYGWCRRVMIECHNKIVCEDGWVRIVVQRYLVNEYSWRLLYWPAEEKSLTAGLF